MEFNIETILIVLPFVFIAGIIDSIAGGGGLINFAGFMLAGVPIHNIMGTNKTQSFFGTSIATANYIKNKHINLVVAIISSIFAIIGAIIGSNIALFLDADFLKLIILCIIPFTGLIIIFKLKPNKTIPLPKNSILYPLCALIGFVLGLYDGLIGPGTGTFLIIAFSMIGVNILDANGSSKLVNLCSNVGSTIVFLINGKVLIWLVIPCIIVNMIANYIGSNLAINKGLKIIKPTMIVVLIILCLTLIKDLL